ncbi:alpha/beta hydrolase [Dinghuibacter silviterrae]|uniref:Pimeloyl-ACP methyl ester carboxylesterase n=1 Tax=Dinghuibacter silviterrae TaxID=1539049 RepID=A0A4R8DHD0_9BACT|nr:alpha/beta hydrolase [Dinghuibacter silviterrae]TDW96360.1 pimeloyl-ACP methyl ester carboxylesterase [Dinghuibacter silviterrae]
MTSLTLVKAAGLFSLFGSVLLRYPSPGDRPSGSAGKVHNIVLVHGAWADGSGWESVYKILKDKGYHVTVVPNPNTSLTDDVKITKAVLAMQDGPTILVGHSYGGAIITEAGDDPKVAGLVYVAAFAPDAGESLLKMQQAGPADPNTPILPPQDGFIWLDKSKFHEDFCADLPAGKAAFMADAQVPVGVAAFTTDLTTAAWKTKKSWYIVSKKDRMIPPDVERMMAKRAGSTVTEIDASHAVYVSHPAEVAAVIEKAATN